MSIQNVRKRVFQTKYQFREWESQKPRKIWVYVWTTYRGNTLLCKWVSLTVHVELEGPSSTARYSKLRISFEKGWKVPSFETTFEVGPTNWKIIYLIQKLPWFKLLGCPLEKFCFYKSVLKFLLNRSYIQWFAGIRPPNCHIDKKEPYFCIFALSWIAI